MIFVGIDPGLSGAIAAITENGNVVSLQDTPTVYVQKSNGGKKNTYVEASMATLLENCRTAASIHAHHAHLSGESLIVTVEIAQAMPGQGVTSMFSIGVGFGIWRGICAALRVPIQYVTPVKWKRDMGLKSGADKAASVVLASRIFPRAELGHAFRGRTIYHDGRAEALLIAEWARRNRNGN